MQKHFLCIFLAALAVQLALPCRGLFARDVTITVVDDELDIALEGAIVHTWDNKTAECNSEGRAVITVPDDSQVKIQITYPGYAASSLTIPANGGTAFSVRMRMGSVMQNRELVIEASRPGNETKSGRSITMPQAQIEQSGEIGIIEDVMNAIKLLPGVGYSNMFNAQPSIRGGDPGDLTAVLDGFLVSNPYHWAGAFSIFDPRMVESATLSHGVFSSRYGHTISGLLEITSRKPSRTDMEISAGLSSSSVNFDFSHPFGKTKKEVGENYTAPKGGIIVLGKLTFWDPFVALAQSIVNANQPDSLIASGLNAIKKAPYIRDASFSANYRFTDNLEVFSSGFIGTDGVAVKYDNVSSGMDFRSGEMLIDRAIISGALDNQTGFLIAGLTYNPLANMVLKTTVGAGYAKMNYNADIEYDINAPYSDGFITEHDCDDHVDDDLINGKSAYKMQNELFLDNEQLETDFQIRSDYDWEIGKGFLFAAGAEEMFKIWKLDTKQKVGVTLEVLPGSGNFFDVPIVYELNIKNTGFFSSAYVIGEYKTPDKRFGTELGVRLDHLHFVGNDFSIKTVPVINPRLNLDFNVFKKKSFIDSFDLTLGTGLFSSMNDSVQFIASQNGIDDYELKQNRAWTSVFGLKLDFLHDISFNIEAYYKYVFDRAYSFMTTEVETANVTQENGANSQYHFDGEGRVAGFDFILQKAQGKYFDGWLSYSFVYARYHDPQIPPNNSGQRRDMWYFPNFHRYHNLNIAFNVKPVKFLNIYTRFGYASGRPEPVVKGKPESYKVTMPDDTVIERWKRTEEYSDTNRGTFSIPLDVKLSFYIPPNKKQQERARAAGIEASSHWELYIAVEDILARVKGGEENTTFNTYTGKEDTGSTNVSYGIGIPMVSIGVKWRY